MSACFAYEEALEMMDHPSVAVPMGYMDDQQRWQGGMLLNY